MIYIFRLSKRSDRIGAKIDYKKSSEIFSRFMKEYAFDKHDFIL